MADVAGGAARAKVEAAGVGILEVVVTPEGGAILAEVGVGEVIPHLLRKTT